MEEDDLLWREHLEEEAAPYRPMLSNLLKLIKSLTDS